MTRTGGARAGAGVVLVALALGACVHGRGATVAGTAAGDPRVVLKRFLLAAGCVATAGCPDQARGLETMGLTFGTRDGALLTVGPRPEVERRMYALASLLRSDTFAIGRETVVPGRLGEAVGLEAALRRAGRDAALPVTMVRTKAGSWLVERLEVERLR